MIARIVLEPELLWRTVEVHGLVLHFDAVEALDRIIGGDPGVVPLAAPQRAHVYMVWDGLNNNQTFPRRDAYGEQEKQLPTYPVFVGQSVLAGTEREFSRARARALCAWLGARWLQKPRFKPAMSGNDKGTEDRR